MWCALQEVTCGVCIMGSGVYVTGSDVRGVCITGSDMWCGCVLQKVMCVCITGSDMHGVCYRK